MSDYEPEDRQQQILSAVLKVLGVAVVIGLVIGLGSWMLVKGLGLDDADTGSGPIRVAPVTPSALPTTALTPTDAPTGAATDEPTDEPTEDPTPTFASEGLVLSASPVRVAAMERINLTGQWAGRDNVSLLVQRFEDGEWVDFGVQTQVSVGTFDTYVLTGREGRNKFRVYDPETGTASNEVTVTIG